MTQEVKWEIAVAPYASTKAMDLLDAGWEPFSAFADYGYKPPRLLLVFRRFKI